MKIKIKFITLWLLSMITSFQVIAVDDIYYSTADAEADKVAYDKKRMEENEKLHQQTLVIKSKEQQLVKAQGDTIFIEDTSIVGNNYYLDTIVVVDDSDFEYTRRLNAFHDTDYEIYDATGDDNVNVYLVNDYGLYSPYYDYWSYRNWRYGYLWGVGYYPYYSYNPFWYGHHCYGYCHHHHHHHHPIFIPSHKPSFGGSSTAHRANVRNSGNRRVSASSANGVGSGVRTSSYSRESGTVARSSGGTRSVVRGGMSSNSRASVAGVGSSSQRTVSRSGGAVSQSRGGTANSYNRTSSTSRRSSLGSSSSYGRSSYGSSSGSSYGSSSGSSYRSSSGSSYRSSSGSSYGSSSGSSYGRSSGGSMGGGRSSGGSMGGGRSSGGRR